MTLLLNGLYYNLRAMRSSTYSCHFATQLLSFLAVTSGLQHLCISSAGAQTGRIDTFAGGGLPNGLPALQTPLGGQYSITMAQDGAVFVSATHFNVVFRISPSGTATVFAGNGTQSYRGDGLKATDAGLSPWGIAVDVASNLFIADSINGRVLKVDGRTGLVSTVAGNGAIGFTGDGGNATLATLGVPRHVAVDSAGNVFILEFRNRRIRRVDATTGVITTVAGNGGDPTVCSPDGTSATSANLSGNINGIAIDAAGNVLISDAGCGRIRRVDRRTGVISTVAGNGNGGFSGDGGSATSASLSSPLGIALDSAGNLFIADSNNDRVRRVDARTAMISTVAGNGRASFSGDGGKATDASLASPNTVTIDAAGNLLIGDRLNNRIRRVLATSGIITTIGGNGTSDLSGDGGLATSATLSAASGVAVDPAGNVIIIDTDDNRIRRVAATSGIITTVAGSKADPGFSGDGEIATSASLGFPRGIALDSAGNLFIAENARVRRVDASTGIITTVAGTGRNTGPYGDGGPATAATLAFPKAVIVDPSGNLLIADTDTVRMVNGRSGIITTIAGNGTRGFSGDGGPATKAQLSAPNSLALDRMGNVFIADNGNYKIRRVDAQSGMITSVRGVDESGDGSALDALAIGLGGIAADAAGNLFIAEDGAHRIRRVDRQTGLVTTVAGTGRSGFSGDGGRATNASLNNPRSVAVDAVGSLYIADSLNYRVRRISFDVPPVKMCSISAAASPLDGTTGTIILSATECTPAFSITVSTESGGDWLSVTPTTGNVPATLTVSADPTLLDPGEYHGAVHIDSPEANNSPVVVEVVFIVQADSQNATRRSSSSIKVR